MKKNILLFIMSAFFYLFMVIINALANILPINNIDTGAVSDSYPNLFAPAGITFSIWGIIYLLLFAYVLYQFGIWQKDKGLSKKFLFEKIAIYFSISSILNIFWIFSWHYDYIGFSVLLIIGILISLIKIENIIKKEKFSLKDKFFIFWPFSLYLGWISVATIANIAVFLVSISWNGLGLSESFWTVVVLLVGAFIGLMKVVKDKNIPYGLVFIWAYIGILIKHVSYFYLQYKEIITTLIICLVIFFISQIFLLRNYFLKSK